MKLFPVIGLLVTSFILALELSAAVPGRYVRFEAPASPGMAVHEIEVWSGGTNIAFKNGTLKFSGTGYQARDINFRDGQRSLVDGITDFKSRGFTMSTTNEFVVNPWVEIDLGRVLQLEQVVVTEQEKPMYADRSLRLVTVLDEARRVTFSTSFDIRCAPFDKGAATLKLDAGRGPLIGRVVPPETAQWAPLADMIEPQVAPPPDDAAARAAVFAQRNSPTAIAQLARDFFARMDLAKPELRGVREKYERGDFSGALDAYRDHFIAKVQSVTFLHEFPVEQSLYAAAADDLLRNISVVFARADAMAQRFSPGTIYWGYAPEGDKNALDVAQVRCAAGNFQRPLLTAYRATGRAEYLAQWVAITDDWGLNIRNEFAQSKQDLRNYFVKGPTEVLNHLADEIGITARARPEIAKLLSGATLARLLIPVLEEYPPAYWWTCRRATFNHTYNALNIASVTARVLDDFHAGQRLDRENRQHWERVWTMNMTRDGSMNEVGDEGHLFMQWRMGVFFNQMKKTPPPWFTPDFAAEFETGWRQTALYPIRHLSPDGRGHRVGIGELFNQIWALSGRTCDYGNMIPRETVDSAALLRQPEVAGILQSVFGAAHDRAKLSPARQEAWDKVTGFYGTNFIPPSTASDWLPYAGLHYLRRSWEPDATFVAMISQTPGAPSTSVSDWNTEFQMWDYGQPLVACGPVLVDGLPQFADAGRQTYWPGSKTERLAVSSERPIPARWHTSTRFDYAESYYEGAYQKHGYDYRAGTLKLGDKIITDARAARSVIMVRPARLVIVTDSVRVPDDGNAHRYEIMQRFFAPEPLNKGDPVSGSVKGDATALTLHRTAAPGVTVRRFSNAKLSADNRTQPSWGRAGYFRAETKGALGLTTLIEPHRRDGDVLVKVSRDLSAPGVNGFSATLADGATLTWLATDSGAQTLKAGPLSIEAEGLLLWQGATETCGLALGVKSAGLQATDFEFTLDGATLANIKPIHRPIEPVTFSPGVNVFAFSAEITLASATPSVEIRYTLDGTEPDLASPRYVAPIKVTKDTFIRARAFRAGVKTMPFTAAGTDMTVVSDARFRKRTLWSALATTATKPGLRWELVDGNWFALFSHLNLPAVMPAKAIGETEKFPDVSMRVGDGPFGVRYSGFIKIPADGVWTFHAPAEYVGASCEPGYDLRVWIDGEEWDLGQRFHGRGQWSVPLAKGAHRLLITFADARHRDRTVHGSGLWRGYPTPWVVWKGEAPVIELSGPGMDRQPLPSGWLTHEAH